MEEHAFSKNQNSVLAGVEINYDLFVF